MISMTKEGSGSFRFPKRGRTGIIYVSSDLVIDSTFPFKEDESLRVKIEGNKLVIEKVKA
jgi:hypothetical protein